MEEMTEASSTSFAMEEESTRMARMILNNNNKSSTKFFKKENNKDKEVPCLDDLYDVPRKEERILGKKNKENSEIKVKGGSLVWWEKGKRKENSLSLSLRNVGVHTTHFTFHFFISHGKWWK